MLNLSLGSFLWTNRDALRISLAAFSLLRLFVYRINRRTLPRVWTPSVPQQQRCEIWAEAIRILAKRDLTHKKKKGRWNTHDKAGSCPVLQKKWFGSISYIYLSYKSNVNNELCFLSCAAFKYKKRVAFSRLFHACLQSPENARPRPENLFVQSLGTAPIVSSTNCTNNAVAG